MRKISETKPNMLSLHQNSHLSVPLLVSTRGTEGRTWAPTGFCTESGTVRLGTLFLREAVMNELVRHSEEGGDVRRQEGVVRRVQLSHCLPQ